MIVYDVFTGVPHVISVKHWHPTIYTLTVDRVSLCIGESQMLDVINMLSSEPFVDPYEKSLSPGDKGNAHLCACDVSELLSVLGYTAKFGSVFDVDGLWNVWLYVNPTNERNSRTTEVLVEFKGQQLRVLADEIVQKVKENNT